ncbi:MAG: DUF2325 domain-containing protein [Desulfopila sp.]
MKKAKESTSQKMAGKRSTVWQLSPALHCSIIGSCLSRTSLRRIAKKQIFGFTSVCSDYKIHQSLVKAVAERNEKSRALNKLLDAKYRTAIRQYATIVCVDDLYQQWKKDVADGDVAGAYWAVLTHPCMNSEMAGVIYGECHMLSFDTFGSRRRQGKKVEQLMQKITGMAKQTDKERDLRIRAEQQLKDQQQEKALLLAEQEKREQELASLRRWIRSLEGRLDVETSEGAERMYEHLEEQQHHEKKRMCVINSLEEQLRDKDKKVETLLERHEKYEQQIKTLVHHFERQNEEKTLLESTLLASSSDDQDRCQCSDSGGCNCPGPDLCGKAVLYVGGQRKMIPRYKDLVEKHGGIFLHHDGGRETSRHVLSKMLGRADAVFCPVDCVSHEACKKVKKTCKRSSKPFVMMRSSGVSSLAKGLQAIIQ